MQILKKLSACICLILSINVSAQPLTETQQTFNQLTAYSRVDGNPFGEFVNSGESSLIFKIWNWEATSYIDWNSPIVKSDMTVLTVNTSTIDGGIIAKDLMVRLENDSKRSIVHVYIYFIGSVIDKVCLVTDKSTLCYE